MAEGLQPHNGDETTTAVAQQAEAPRDQISRAMRTQQKFDSFEGALSAYLQDNKTWRALETARDALIHDLEQAFPGQRETIVEVVMDHSRSYGMEYGRGL